jgi:hypothetical protein
MQTIELIKIEHSRKKGVDCEYIEPTITESCYLKEGDEVIGAYFSDASELFPKLAKYMAVANAEFLSKRVPKTPLKRSDVMQNKWKHGLTYKEACDAGTVQYSTIIGNVPARKLMRRDYHNRSAVHAVESAQTFIKAMLLASNEIEEAMASVLPEQYEAHKKALEGVDDEWRFGNLFTSSISNYNISAPFHQDISNIKETLNAIYTVRHNSNGGSLYVPDYDACFEMPSGSLLFYPAWRNMHAVTPIIPTHDGGYRNSLIFYAIKAFKS